MTLLDLQEAHEHCKSQEHFYNAVITNICASKERHKKLNWVCDNLVFVILLFLLFKF